MKIKLFATFGLLSLLFLGAVQTSAEARHHRHSSFSIGFGASTVRPVYEPRVVEYYYPAYQAPVYVQDPYGRPAVVYQAPVLRPYAREVYVAPRVPVRQEAGFSWFFGW